MNKRSQPPIETSWRLDNINWVKRGRVKQALLVTAHQTVDSDSNTVRQLRARAPWTTQGVCKPNKTKLWSLEKKGRQQVKRTDYSGNIHIADPQH